MNPRFPLSLLAAALLGGCAAVPAPAPERPAPEAAVEEATVEVAAAEPTAELTPDVLYGVLLGEIAGQRRHLDVAVAAYLHAAKNSDDPQVARRATRIAVYGQDNGAALEAARRWVELAPEEADAHQTEAVFHVRLGEVVAAVDAFERYLARLEETREGFRSVVHLLAQEKNPEVALKVLERLAANHPEEPEAAFAHARMAMEAQRHDEALSEVDRALVLRGDWRDARLLRAQILIALGKEERAVEELRAAVAAEPGDRPLRMAYARLLVRLRQLDEAGRQFEEIARLAPDNADALYALALLAMEAEELDRAAKYLKRLLKLGNRAAEANYYLAIIAEQQGRMEEALEHLARTRGGEYALNAMIKRAGMLADMGRLEEARGELAGLRADHARLAPRLYQVEGELLRDAGRLEAAMALYDEAVGRYPDDNDLLYARGLLAEKLDRLDILERDLRLIIERDPEHAQALNALGYTLADRTERYREALELIERALTLVPDDAAILDSMGWVRYHLGELEVAEGFLRRAYEKAEDGEIAAHLGEVLWAMERRDEARKVWEEALGREPEHPLLLKVMKRFIP